MTSHFLATIAQLAGLVPMHMGKLHAYEQLLVFGIAFGPFLVLGVVVFIVRRRDLAAEVVEDPEVSSTHPRAT